MIIVRLSEILYNAKNRVKVFSWVNFFIQKTSRYWHPSEPKIYVLSSTALSIISKNSVGRHSLQWGEWVCVSEWSKNYKIQNVEFIDFDVYSRLLVPQEKLYSDFFFKESEILLWIEKMNKAIPKIGKILSVIVFVGK